MCETITVTVPVDVPPEIEERAREKGDTPEEVEDWIWEYVSIVPEWNFED